MRNTEDFDMRLFLIPTFGIQILVGYSSKPKVGIKLLLIVRISVLLVLYVNT